MRAFARDNLDRLLSAKANAIRTSKLDTCHPPVTWPCNTAPVKEAAGMFKVLLAMVVSVMVVVAVIVVAHVMAAPRRNFARSTDPLEPNARVNPASRRPELL